MSIYGYPEDKWDKKTKKKYLWQNKGEFEMINNEKLRYWNMQIGYG